MNATINNSKKNSTEMSKVVMNYRVKYLRMAIKKAERDFCQVIRKDINRYMDNTTGKVIVVDNTGEEADIMHGVVVDKHSALEGHGSTPYLTTDQQLFMRGKEQRIEEQQEKLESMGSSLRGVREEIERLHTAMAKSKEEFGVVFDQDKQSLDSLEKWADKLEGWIGSTTKYMESLEDDIKRIEAHEQAEADYIVKDEKFNTVHWKGVNDFGERLVIKMKRTIGKYSVKQLLKMNDKIMVLRYGDKDRDGVVVRRAGKQLTFKHWVQLWWLINRELAKKTGSKFYKDKVAKAKKMYEDNKLGEIKESEYKLDPDASFFGKASIGENDIIEAIDKSWFTDKEMYEAIRNVRNRTNRA